MGRHNFPSSPCRKYLTSKLILFQDIMYIFQVRHLLNNVSVDEGSTSDYQSRVRSNLGLIWLSNKILHGSQTAYSVKKYYLHDMKGKDARVHLSKYCRNKFYYFLQSLILESAELWYMLSLHTLLGRMHTQYILVTFEPSCCYTTRMTLNFVWMHCYRWAYWLIINIRVIGLIQIKRYLLLL